MWFFNGDTERGLAILGDNATAVAGMGATDTSFAIESRKTAMSREMAEPDDPHFARWLAEYRADEGLSPQFADLVALLHRPLAEQIARCAAARNGLFVVGLCGPQGSGKSTMVRVLARLLEARGLRVAVLSLDDIYLTRAERAVLAREVHPLLATRGPAGTHDVDLGCAVIDALTAGKVTSLPRFDKARDDRMPQSTWPQAAGADIVLFEGWCIGARPERDDTLAPPINDLEREEDADGTWRRYVNAMLGGSYTSLFGRLHSLILLRAPSFDVVAAWRLEQEENLRARTAQDQSSNLMAPSQVRRFVQFFERTTRQIDREMPNRADCVIQLGTSREVVGWSGLVAASDRL